MRNYFLRKLEEIDAIREGSSPDRETEDMQIIARLEDIYNDGYDDARNTYGVMN